MNISSEEKNTMTETINQVLTSEFKIGVVYIDENFNILHVKGDILNRLKQQEIVANENLLEIVPKELELPIRNAIHKATINNKQIFHKALFANLNKVQMAFNLYVSPVKNGSILLFISVDEKEKTTISTPNIVNNITDIKKPLSNECSLLENSNIGTIQLDSEFRLMKFNTVMQKDFNLCASYIGQSVDNFSTILNDNKIFTKVKSASEIGVLQEYEICTTKGDWYMQRITPIYNCKNESTGVLINFININSLKKINKEKYESEIRFKTFFDYMPDMLANYNLNGYLIDCNSRFCKNIGYESKEELIGKHILDLTKEDPITHKKHFNAIKAAGYVENFPRKITRKDGSIIEVNLNAQVIKPLAGREGYIICCYRDITEQKNIERKVLNQHKIFHFMLEGTQTGFWDWNIQDNTEYLSPTYKQMFGYEDHELENTYETWQKIIHPDDLKESLQASYKHLKRNSTEPYTRTQRFIHKNGSIVWVLVSGIIIEWDKNGKPSRMVGSHVNITPIKNIEEELLRSNTELEQFAYVASHDLQEPLNTINDFVNLFIEQYRGKLDQEAEQYLYFINQASERMRNLVKSILNYSRTGQEKTKVDIDLNNLVKNIVEDMAMIIKETGAKITYKKLPIIKGSFFDIHSLFYNLISNSIKFRKANVPPVITISSDKKPDAWCFQVKDNGIGIAEKNIVRIFDIFHRLHNSDTYKGTGIGLAQCKKIVQLNGGDIFAESELGEGTAFNFTLARSDKKNQATTTIV